METHAKISRDFPMEFHGYNTGNPILQDLPIQIYISSTLSTALPKCYRQSPNMNDPALKHDSNKFVLPPNICVFDR